MLQRKSTGQTQDAVPSAQRRTGVTSVFALGRQLVSGSRSIQLSIRISRTALFFGVIFCVAQWLIVGVVATVPTVSQTVPIHRASMRADDDFLLARIESPSTDAPPWGNITCQSISISPPIEHINRIDILQCIHDWFLPEMGRGELRKTLVGFGLSNTDREALLALSEIDGETQRTRIRITNELIESIPIAVRGKIYHQLAKDPLNHAQISAFRFPCDSIDEWFEGVNLRKELVDLVEQHAFRSGPFLVMADLRLLLPELRDERERLDLIRVLCRERTMMINLRITRESNIDELARYWGRYGRAKDVKPILEALQSHPEGGEIDISHLFPAFVRRRLYGYATPQADPLSRGRDCHWTATNFFNSRAG